MSPYVIVLLSPVLIEQLHPLGSVNCLPVETLVSELTAEALDVPVLPGITRCNVQRLGPNLTKPAPDHIGCELRTVIGSDLPRDSLQLRTAHSGNKVSRLAKSACPLLWPDTPWDAHWEILY